MSDYSRSVVIRLRASLDRLGVKDIRGLENKYAELFDNNIPCFEIAPTEEEFVDYVLKNTYGVECGEFGFSRKLRADELEIYLPLFQLICPDVTEEDLRYVDYCFYNCSEAPDYFDET